MTQEAKGVFIPYQLLAIIITITCMVIGGIIAIEVQVSSLNTTLLLRDADTRAATRDLQEKAAQLEVYIHDMREKSVGDRKDIEELKRRR